MDVGTYKSQFKYNRNIYSAVVSLPVLKRLPDFFLNSSNVEFVLQRLMDLRYSTMHRNYCIIVVTIERVIVY